MLVGRFMEPVPEYTFEPHAYLADDEHGVILQRSHYKRGNEILDSNDTFVCHFRDGQDLGVLVLERRPIHGRRVPGIGPYQSFRHLGFSF